jgi:hypothetical protein
MKRETGSVCAKAERRHTANRELAYHLKIVPWRCPIPVTLVVTRYVMQTFNNPPAGRAGIKI